MASLATVRSLYRAMRENDDPAVFALCTDDIVWEQSQGFPGGSTWLGPAAVIENVFRANAKRWTGFAFYGAAALIFSDVGIRRSAN